VKDADFKNNSVFFYSFFICIAFFALSALFIHYRHSDQVKAILEETNNTKHDKTNVEKHFTCANQFFKKISEKAKKLLSQETTSGMNMETEQPTQDREVKVDEDAAANDQDVETTPFFVR
jgi:uncharacterized membrane-anchored protein YhcB (DUF1043 family)